MQSFSSFSSSSCFVCLISLNGAGGGGGEHTSHHCSTSASRTTLPATDCHSPGNEQTRVKDSRVRRAWGTLREGSRPRRGAAATPAGRRQHAGSGAEPVTPHGESAGRGGTDVHSDRLVSAGQLYEGSW